VTERPAPPAASAGDVPAGHAPRRRGALLAVAALAGLAGAGAAWWSQQPGEAELAGFWGQQFDTPDGGKLALATLRGRPLLVNFWATWCPPCIEELPLLSRFYAENKANGWQLLGLAVDRLEPVQRFLARAPVGYPVGMAGLAGVDLTRQLGNAAGGLPFTVVLGADGGVRQRKLGQLHATDLAAWRDSEIAAKLNPNRQN
jgi:thiol-disulfide isomerase/thioredoxin